MGDQDPPGLHLSAFRAPRHQDFLPWALEPGRDTATKLGSWKPLQPRGIFAASLCPALGILESGLKKRKEKQKGERQTD